MRLNITSGIVTRAQKVVIYGPEGIGKSTLASKFPGPLFTDTEEGTAHMDVRRTDPPTSWTMLVETVKAIRDTPGVCQTWVLDTVDWAQRLCIQHICDKYQVNNLEDIPYGKGYVHIWEEFGQFLTLLDQLVVRGIHVVITAHATTRPANQPEEFGNYDRYQLKLVDSKQCSSSDLLKEWCDLLLFCNYKTYAVAVNKQKTKFKGQGNQRVMYTTRFACWDAKNRLGLPEELPLDYTPLAPFFGTTAPAPLTPAAAPVPAPDTNPAPASIPVSTSVQPPASASMPVQPPAGEQDKPYQNPIPDSRNYTPATPVDNTPPLRVDTATGEILPNAAPSSPPVAGAASTVGTGPAQNTQVPQTAQATGKCLSDDTVTVTDWGYIGPDGQPLKDSLQEFYPLMEMAGVTIQDVYAALRKKEYIPRIFPEGMLLANMPDDFIRGVLIGAWDQVKAVIEETRADDLPFTFGKEE